MTKEEMPREDTDLIDKIEYKVERIVDRKFLQPRQMIVLAILILIIVISFVIIFPIVFTKRLKQQPGTEKINNLEHKSAQMELKIEQMTMQIKKLQNQVKELEKRCQVKPKTSHRGG